MRTTANRRTTVAISAALASVVLVSAAPAATAADGSSDQARAETAARTVENATGTGDLTTGQSAPGTATRTATRDDTVHTTVTAPDRADGHVAATAADGSTVTLGLPNTRGVPARTAGAGTVVYPDAAPDTDLAVQTTTDGSARALTTLKNTNAAKEQRFDLGLPAGTEAVPTDDGGYDLVQHLPTGGTWTRGRIDPPWAKDAHGKPVPTSYKLDGTTLVQTVDIDDQTAYPVVADPKWSWGWVSGTVSFNKNETIALAGNSGFLAAVLSFAPPPFSAFAKLAAAYAANIARQAGIDAARGRCTMVKLPAFQPRTHTGRHCR